MILRGIRGLLASRKGTLVLIILGATATLAAFGKLDPTFGVVMGVVSSIYCFVQARLDAQYNNATNRSGNPNV